MPTREPVDLLIEARWVFPIAPVNTVLTDHAIAVSDGRIVAIGRSAELRARFDAREHIVRGGHALLPGFVNAHTCAATALLRGVRVHGPRDRWLRQTVGPVESSCMSPDFVREGTQLAIAEMLLAGITSFGDMYWFPEEAARAASSARVRAAIGLPVADVTTPSGSDSIAHLAQAERLWDEYASDPWVSLYFAPCASWGVSDETLTRVRSVADELDARVTMHADRQSLSHLQSVGLLRPGFTAVQTERLSDQDMEIISRTGISMVTCPQANLRLGSGDSVLTQLDVGQVSLGLGTDSPAAVGALDMLAEARTAVLIAAANAARSADPDAVVISSEAVLRMATLGSASALGLSSLVGSLEPGKAADIICLDLTTLACQPGLRPADMVVFQTSRGQVCDVWTSGRVAVSGGRLVSFDEQGLLALAELWAERVRAGVAE